jgi:hypothetical protein
MVEQQPRREPEARSAPLRDPPASAAPGAAGRAAWEWWWAGRLRALYSFPVECCPCRTPGEPRRRWLAGFAAGARMVAARRAAGVGAAA